MSVNVGWMSKSFERKTCFHGPLQWSSKGGWESGGRGSYLMAVIYDDENISSMASSKWAVVTRPGESGFWQENSQISVARLQMSRQRRASPERAATYKRQYFIPWDPLVLSVHEKNQLILCSAKKEGRRTFLVVQWLQLHLPMHGVSVWSLVRELRSHIPLGHGTEATLQQIQ